MSTLGIVAISLVGGAFILLLLIASGLLIYQSIQSRKLMISFLTQMEETRKGIDFSLATHRAEMSKAISSMNGQGLIESAAVIKKCGNQIANSAIALHEIVKTLTDVNAGLVTPPNNLPPEAYGPDDLIPAVLQSKTASLDDRVMMRENEEGQLS